MGGRAGGGLALSMCFLSSPRSTLCAYVPVCHLGLGLALPSAEAELAWLREHADDLMASLDEAGALHFRGFCTSTTKPGFRRFCEALPLQPCTDPLASIGVRSLLAKEEGVYEAVNAQALAATYIGLHNDATWALTAPFAAFVCFEAAFHHFKNRYR